MGRGGGGESKRLTLNQLTLQSFELYANAHSSWDHCVDFCAHILIPFKQYYNAMQVSIYELHG